MQEVAARHLHEQEHEKGAGARAEEAVVDADRAGASRQASTVLRSGARAVRAAAGVAAQQRDASTTTSSTGTSARNRCGATCVAIQAPAGAPANAPTAARRDEAAIDVDVAQIAADALKVPARPASLPVPSSVVCGACGNAANSAGSWMSPPPPAIASITPAPNAAASTRRISGLTACEFVVSLIDPDPIA